nr:hypothetical protein [Shewanella putrefaciens]
MDKNKGLVEESVATTPLDKCVVPSDMPCESPLATLWQALYAEGHVGSPQMPESHDMHGILPRCKPLQLGLQHGFYWGLWHRFWMRFLNESMDILPYLLG